MSGIAGVYSTDGRPVDRALVDRMATVMAHRGPDGVGDWSDGPVSLAHLMLHTTPESLQEKQPLTDEAGEVCLTLDGRVDNRDELRAALEARGTRFRTDSDAELVLRAYACWGQECPRQILGDFAFAIWDRRKQNLFCARDPFGVKPLYYYWDGRTFLWASELRALLESPDVCRQPNEGMIAEYLAAAIPNKEETLYRGILRLPPAHSVLVRGGSLRKARYWDLDPAMEIRYRDDDEYAEHFRHLFRTAVRCRLRSHRPVGAQLSGGLDSSSVVCVAQSIARDAPSRAPGVTSFSAVFPGLECDERLYIDEVVRCARVESSQVPVVDPGTWCAEDVRVFRDFPDYPNGVMLHPLKQLAQEQGVRVLLTGEGGDHWLTGSPHQYADLLRARRGVELLRQLWCDGTAYGVGGATRLAVTCGLGPLLPLHVRRGLKRVLKRNGVPPWIAADFAHRVDLADRLGGGAPPKRLGSFAREDLYRVVTAGWAVHCAEMEERSSSRFELEERHPFLDRRLAEFAWALPEEQRRRGAQEKVVLRHAMRGILPEPVRRRSSKAEFSEVFMRALRSHGGEQLFGALAVAAAGWVDGARVHRIYQETTRDYARHRDGWRARVLPLWMVCAMDFWLRNAFPSSTPI